MKILTPNQMAWLIPIVILIHQLEEFFGGFPAWYSNLLNADLSDGDFIVINAIGLFLFTIIALSYLLNQNNFILVALGTLIFVNGMIHLLLSIFTLSYSPGTISGVVLFIPLGIMIYRKILPRLPVSERIIAIATGILVLLAVSIIARNV
jgi:hypothetical protein